MKFKLLLIAMLLSLPSLIFTQTADTLEWTVLRGGNKAGFLKKWQNADGSFTEWYQYNDRGSGDSTVANYRVNEDGFLIYLDAGGVDYSKKAILEKFRIENGIAFWENNTEKGQRRLEQMADYVPLNISVVTPYHAYLQSPDSSKQLLPTGKSRLRVLKEYQLEDGKKVRLIAADGFSMTPEFVWMDNQHRFFAKLGSSSSILPKGYEDQLEELLVIQNQSKDRYLTEITRQLIRKVGSGLIITGARLYDPETGEQRPGANILLKGGKVEAITFGELKIPAGYRQLDATGKFVMPGLWDMHVHYRNPEEALMHLANGTTNVRDMGNSLELVDKKKAIEAGEALGPRIQAMSGAIDGAGELAAPVGEIISSVEEGKIAIKKYKDHGYRQIKLDRSLKPEWVAPLVEEARKYGMRVGGHIPVQMLASEAVAAGYDEISHANMLFLNFYDREVDTRTRARHTTVAEKAASFDFAAEAFKAFVEQLRSENIILDPTVTVFEDLFTGMPGEPSPPYAAIVDRLPVNLQRSFKTGALLSPPEGMQATYQQSFDNMLKMLKVMYDAGITIVPGAESFAGFALHRELENYVKAGIPNREVLKMATVTAAAVAGKAGEYGRIMEGKAADLIIIDGDPTQDISDIRRVEWVILDNNYYRTKDMLEAISVGYFE